MKKGFLYYLSIWVICVIAFNAVFFITGSKLPTGYYWPGYISCMIAFVIQLVCGYIAVNQDTLKKAVYHAPMAGAAYTGIALTLIASIYFVTHPLLPNWIGILVHIVIIAFILIRVISAKAAADIVSSQDEEAMQKMIFIKCMSEDANFLVNRISDPEMKKEAKKVYEAIRYSDPMSTEKSKAIENEINSKFEEFVLNIDNGNKDATAKQSDSLVTLIKQRNSIIRATK